MRVSLWEKQETTIALFVAQRVIAQPLVFRLVVDIFFICIASSKESKINGEGLVQILASQIVQIANKELQLLIANCFIMKQASIYRWRKMLSKWLLKEQGMNNYINIRNMQIQRTFITRKICKNFQCPCSPSFNASSARNLTLEVSMNAVMERNESKKNSRVKIQYAVNALLSSSVEVLRAVKSMDKNLYTSSASFVVPSLNFSAGAQLTSVINATKGR